MILKNKSGFGLIEIVVALGIMGIASVGMMTMNRNQQRAVKASETVVETTGIMAQILLATADPEACRVSFASTKPGYAQINMNSLPVNVTQIASCPQGGCGGALAGDPDANILVKVGPGGINNTFDNGALEITNLQIRQKAGSSYKQELVVTFKRDEKRVGGPSQFTRTIDLNIFDRSLDSDFPDPTAGDNLADGCNTDQNMMIETAIMKSCQGNGAYYNPTTKECFHVIENTTCPSGQLAVTVKAIASPTAKYDDPLNNTQGDRKLKTECVPIQNLLAAQCSATGSGIGFVYNDLGTLKCKIVPTCLSPKILRYDGTNFVCQGLLPLGCPANQIGIINASGDVECKPATCPMDSNGLIQFMTGINSSTGATCQTLVKTANVACSPGQNKVLTAESTGQLKVECCSPSCPNSSTICKGQSYPEPNGCGSCSGGTKELDVGCPSSASLCADGTHPTNTAMPVKSDCGVRCPGLITAQWDIKDVDFTIEKICGLTANQNRTVSRNCLCPGIRGCAGYRTITCTTDTYFAASNGSYTFARDVAEGSVKISAIGGGGGGAGGGTSDSGYAGKAAWPVIDQTVLGIKKGDTCSFSIGAGGSGGNGKASCGNAGGGGWGGHTQVTCNGSLVVTGWAGAGGGKCRNGDEDGYPNPGCGPAPFYAQGGRYAGTRSASSSCGGHNSFGGSGAGGPNKAGGGNGGNGRQGAVQIKYSYGTYGY